jgi:hypothetical protein
LSTSSRLKSLGGNTAPVQVRPWRNNEKRHQWKIHEMPIFLCVGDIQGDILVKGGGGRVITALVRYCQQDAAVLHFKADCLKAEEKT